MKKQEKKFVLAALALLAITGLLALAGCKNDTVPEPTRYTVSFDKGDNSEYTGDLPADITVESGTKLTAEQLEVLDSTDNYIFEGWYDGETKAEGGTYTVTKDVTLVAKWRDRGTVASVTFTPAGGTKFYLGELIEVSLTSEDGATIQYHLGDGSWKDYDAGGKIQVTVDTTIIAKATKDGLKPSDETTATYTVRKLEGISVTPPAQTVYSERQSFDPTGMVVTATYDDKSQREVTGWETDFNTVAGEKGLGKPVTVSYKEGDTTKEATFTIDVASYEFTETVQDVDSSYAGTMTGGNYKKFGDWPQIIKKEGVEIGAGTLVRGGLTYHVGSDGNYYVKAEENAYKSGYKYSDGSEVKQKDESNSPSTRWFKVEPIVWRVLTEDYKAPDGKSTGNALLLAEKILTGGIPYYVDRNTRTIIGAGTKEGDPDTVYPNNWQYSTIRAWLNGSYEEKNSQDETYTDKGFLQTAFTQSARDKIAATTVDNSTASIHPASDPNLWNSGTNPYASDTPTRDKVFLLSEEEATTGVHLKDKGITEDYGFDEYDRWVGDDYGTTTSTRIRVTTDYAKATGAYQNSTPGYGGWWWLRSPYYDLASDACVIDRNGNAFFSDFVDDSNGGVVPALSISLGGN